MERFRYPLLFLILTSGALGSSNGESGTTSGRRDAFTSATMLITTLLDCLNEQEAPKRIYDNKPSPKHRREDCFKNGVLRDLGNVVNLAHSTELDNERLTNEINEQVSLVERQTKEIRELTEEKEIVIEGIRALKGLMQGIKNEFQVLRNETVSYKSDLHVIKEGIGSSPTGTTFDWSKLIEVNQLKKEISALKNQLGDIKSEVTALQNATKALEVIMKNESSKTRVFSDRHIEFRDQMEIRTNLTNELMTAINQKNTAAIHLLVELGADVNSRFNGSETPLHRAANSNEKFFAVRTIKFLIENDADPHAKDDEGYTFLHRLVDDGTTLTPSQCHEIASLLVSRNASEIFNFVLNVGKKTINSRCVQEYNLSTTFQTAVKNLEIQNSTLSLLQKNGVNFNSVNSLRDSVLYYALMGRRSTKFLSDLVHLGANPRHLNIFNQDLLPQTLRFGSINEIKFFLDQGIDINSTDRTGWNPLHEAVYCNGNVVETVRFLIEKGVNVNLKDQTGKTPLNKAWESARIADPDYNQLIQLLTDATQ